MTEQGKTIRIYYAAIQCLYWAQNAVCFAFASYYLKACGFTGAVMGAVFAGANLFGFLFPNLIGTQIDRGRISSTSAALLVLAAETLCLIPLLAVRSANLSVAVCYTFLLSLQLTVNAVYTKICVDFQRSITGLSYGKPRALGSFSYALCAWAAGQLLYGRPLVILPASALLLTFLQALAVIRLAPVRKALSISGEFTQTAGRSMLSFLKNHTRFVVLLMGIALIFAAHNTINNFLYLIVEDLNGTEKTLGSLSAFIGLIEVPTMLLYASRKRPRPHRLLALSLVCFVLKVSAIWGARSTGQLFAAFSLQAISFALYTPVMVDYVDRVIPYADSAKGQSLSNSMVSLGTLAATLFSGYWIDTYPVKSVLFRLFILTIIGLPMCLCGIDWRSGKK